MARRHLLWAVGVLLVVGGSAFGWRTWARWSAIELPAVLGPKATAIDPDAPGLINVERVGLPRSATIGDMVREADAVLVVQLYTDVTERHVTQWKSSVPAVQPQSPMMLMALRNPAPAPPPPTLRTIYSFKVRQTIKGAMREGDTVRIAREGGRQTFEDDFPRPGVGEKFVVFLKWWTDVGAYRHHYGPLTTFRVVNFRIHPVGRSFEKLLGRREDQFIRELRAITSKR
jgi:hypothetical protein